MLEKYDVAADVWSVTSYQELYRDGHACERWNMLHPAETPRVPYVTQCLKDAPGVFVAASDYLQGPARLDRSLDAAADPVARHRRLRPQRGPRRAARVLRGRRALRRRRHAGRAAKEGQLDAKVVAQAIKDFGIDAEKPNPRGRNSGHNYRCRQNSRSPNWARTSPPATSSACSVAPGDTIAKDQPVLELETDKATIEVPSRVAGTVEEVRVKPGEKVKVGQVVLTVEDGAGAKGKRREGGRPRQEVGRRRSRSRKPAGRGAKASEPDGGRREPRTPDDERRGAGAPSAAGRSRGGRQRRRRRRRDEARAAPEARGGRRHQPWRARSRPRRPSPRGPAPPAAPSVRRLARELGVDIRLVQRQRPGGRIGVEDVQGFVAGGAGARRRRRAPSRLRRRCPTSPSGATSSASR